ncbi:MAG: 16S rRNA (adenine(1518)-N(6)/adenine(1519)-N(6))-dimethyltransferase RsmA [Pseudomonadota bacterium]
MAEERDASPFKAKKALGQHFLFDPDILRRVALATGSVEHQTVIEVGPGPGGLTRALLDQGAEPLICIEKDPRFAEALRLWPEAENGRLVVYEGDARKAPIEALIRDAKGHLPAKIIANLPYNVGTPLLIDWLKTETWRGDMALMFQKEVALRICAQPGSPHYGRLAVLSQSVCNTQLAFSLPPGAFRPPPKVDSAVVVLTPLDKSLRYSRPDVLEQVTAAAFGQRRKMLRSALKSIAKQNALDPQEWLEQAGIDPTARAETLSQADYRALADQLIGTD